MVTFQKSLDNINKNQIKGLPFEKLVKWYFENSSIYKNIINKVWLWNEWPGRWGIDKGIDIVIETKKGDLWAVQCKDYSDNHYIKYSDVSNFLAESNRKDFEFRLLVSSNNLIGKNAQEAINGQEKPVGLIFKDDLKNEDLDWPLNLRKKSKPHKKLKPRKHQNIAIKSVVSAFNENDKGKLIMACGTGKTLTSLWIKEELNAETAIVFVPSISLLRQTLRPWLLNANQEFRFITVCSDKTVDKSDYDQLNDKTSLLGVPTTTDPRKISKFLNLKGKKVIFSTYQSSRAIYEAQQKTNKKISLMILDEAHKLSGGESYFTENIFGNKQIKTDKQLFMTATPKIVNKGLKKIADEKEYKTYSMDDEETFGLDFHKLSFGDAIQQKLLVDYEIIVFSILDSEVEKLIKSNKSLQSNEDTLSSYELASQIGLASASKKYKIKRVISFHNRVNNAKRYASSLDKNKDLIFPKSKKIYSSYVSGKMSSEIREKELNNLSNDNYDFSIVSNARCLSEGIDVPNLDAIAFIDPRHSTIDIVQAIGRAIRTANKKEKGYIFIPIILDKNEEIGQQLSESSFSQIAKVLEALKAHDERLVEELKNLVIKKITYGTKSKIPNFTFEIPEKLNESFIDNIAAQLITDLNENWYLMYERLLKYYKANNTSHVNHREIVDGVKLGKWTGRQRELYKKGLLPNDKIMLLQDSFSDWVWDRELELVLNHIADWKKYEKKYDDIYINPSKDRKTALWIQYINKSFRESSLNEETYSIIKKHFPTYDFKNFREVTFFRQVEEYKECIKEFGIENITETRLKNYGKYINKGFLHVLRINYKKGTLANWKLDIINQEVPDFIWDKEEYERNQKRLIFEKYVRNYGSAKIPRNLVFEGIHLGNWASLIRSKYSTGKITEEEKKYFNKFIKKGWKWSETKTINDVEVSDRFYKMFNMLKEFYDQNGKSIVSIPENEKLSYFEKRQRKYGKEKLNRNQQKLFENTFSDWYWGTKGDYEWDNNFLIIQDYNRKFGLPAKEDEIYKGLNINKWIRTQKSRHSQKKLKDSRVQNLKIFDQDFFVSKAGKLSRSSETINNLQKDRQEALDKFLKCLDTYGKWPRNDFHIDEYYPIRFAWQQRSNMRKNTISKDFINEINKQLLKRNKKYIHKFWNTK